MGYIQIYIYNLCMRNRGWLPNSTPVEACGKRTPWVSTCFNMFQPSKGGAGFRKNPLWFISFGSKQWLLYLNKTASMWFYMFFGTRITSLIVVLLPMGQVPSVQVLGPPPSAALEIARGLIGWFSIGKWPWGHEVCCTQPKKCHTSWKI